MFINWNISKHLHILITYLIANNYFPYKQNSKYTRNYTRTYTIENIFGKFVNNIKL